MLIGIRRFGLSGVFRYYIKRDATSTTFLQYFYNKSQVVSGYWFKFQTKSNITFLPQ